MNEPLTLYFLIERVARLREAQRWAAKLPTNYNKRQVDPLTEQVEDLVERAGKTWLYPEFSFFVKDLTEMLQAQECGLVDEAHRLEARVDAAVARLVSEAKLLNQLLRVHGNDFCVYSKANQEET